MAMESGQEITVGAWVELESQLAEVRAKRDQLDAQNLRVTDNLRRTIEERDKAVAEVAELREEYLRHKEAANANSDQAAALREQLQEMTSQRDAVERTADAMRISRDEARKASADLQIQLSMWQVAHDTLKAERETVIRYRDEMRVSWDEARTAVAELQDTIEELRATNKQYQSDWVVAMEELARAREAADMFEAENTALRDTVRTLRATQIHPDLPGLLCAIQGATEQARELI